MKKLAIVTTHPIQYNAPFFQRLAQQEGLEMRVFYTWGEAALNKYDPGFSKTIEWNIPLLEGYASVFVRNVAKEPGSHHFRGIDNPTLVKEIADWKPAAILVYGWCFKSHLQVLRFFSQKIPVWFRGDSIQTGARNPLRSWLRKQVLSWVYRHVSVAFYTGSLNKAYFKAYGLKEEQLQFMPHAIDNERFMVQMDDERGKRWRMQQGIPPEKVLFLYAGKLTRSKGVDLLIEAFGEAALPNAHLLIVGSGLYEQALKKKASCYQDVSFLPFQNQSEMPLLYKNGDVLVIPSRHETWALVINEAMASGLPVLASNACGAVPDLIRRGWNGEIFRNNDGKDLCEKIKTFAGAKDRLKQMGKNAESSIASWNYEAGCRAVSRVLAQNNQPGEGN